MKIQILSVDTTTKVSKAGKNYQNAEVAYKNFDSGKVESKNINQYNKTFKHVAEASAGQTAEVGVMKNDAGYWEWDTFKRVVMTEQEKTAPVAETVSSLKPQVVAAKSTYETPEERAKKQVYIVKQSSLSVASNLLSVGAKTPPKKEDVVELAQYFVDYVFGEKKEDLFDLPNDLDVE